MKLIERIKEFNECWNRNDLALFYFLVGFLSFPPIFLLLAALLRL